MANRNSPSRSSEKLKTLASQIFRCDELASMGRGPCLRGPFYGSSLGVFRQVVRIQSGQFEQAVRSHLRQIPLGRDGGRTSTSTKDLQGIVVVTPIRVAKEKIVARQADRLQHIERAINVFILRVSIKIRPKLKLGN